jgi:GT2 family glycosyltransferase
MEHQLAQFAADSGIAGADLVYVLDSPELADTFDDMAPQLFALYGVPFRTVVLRNNIGFSGANNAGASVARGRLLLLMNSDVIPDQPGWLGALTDFHQRTPDIGALGLKLLYEDDTLQHAGLYFSRSPRTQLWNNEHYFKGFDRHLPAANVARPVPAISAACLLIDAAVYRDVGGLRGCYVRADFEDSDLCLRLIEAGLTNWYQPAVELYHLEGQSFSTDERRQNYQYNRWLQTFLWNDRIEQVMSNFAGAS